MANKPFNTVQDLGHFSYIHTNDNLISLRDIIQTFNWRDPLDNSKFIGVCELLDYDDGFNRKSVRDSYESKNREQRSPNYIRNGEEDSFIAIGTILKIPNQSSFYRDIAYKEELDSFVTKDRSVNTFLINKLKKVLQSPTYKVGMTSSDGTSKGELSKSFPTISVWIWCKSLGDPSLDANFPFFDGPGKIFNLTPYIQNLNTSSGKNGGNFSFTLPPITCECEMDGWKTKNMNGYNDQKKNSQYNYISSDKVFKKGLDSEVYRNRFLFHDMINTNDIVFISLDKQSIEFDPASEMQDGDSKNQRYIDQKYIPNYELPFKIYDLIGLVDRNTINYSAGNASMSISISGRDLSKLLIDDGTYYLAAPGLNPTEGIFKNDDPENWGRAWRGKGEFLIPQQTNDKSQIFYSIFGDSSLRNIMIHLFSTFATIEVCPDEVFSAYDNKSGERSSEYSYYDPIEKKEKIFKGAGIWKIIKVLINDEGVMDRTIIDKSLAVHEGSLISAIKKYAQEPFVEMISDTYGDMYYHIFRRPPYDEKGFRSMVKLIDELSFENSNDNPLIIKESEIVSDTLQFYDGDVFCWYWLVPQEYDGENEAKNYYNNQLPIIYFREYNEIWGNKQWRQYSNYLPYNQYTDNNLDPKVLIQTAEMLKDDLRFVVESNAYLPFTRRGSITIKMDRRIKKGVVIRHQGTREVFLVEGVSHSYSVSESNVDATTTLQVSRGMVEKDESGNDVLDLYFNVIHFGQTTKSSKSPIDDKKENKKILQVYFDTDKPYLLTVDEKKLSNGDEFDLKMRQQFRDKSVRSIHQVADDLITNMNLSVEIIGHTDIRQTSFPGGNENLSLQRANSVVETLKLAFRNRNGGIEIEKNRITSKGVGSKEPYASDNNSVISKERQQELDRRVEVIYKYDSKSKQKATQPIETNPYSNWYVNQSIFNFFLKRRQFCSQIIPTDALISSHNLRTSGKKLEFVTNSTIQDVKNINSSNENQLA